MDKVSLPERADWKKTAEANGFQFHTMHGEPYWDESSAYALSLEQIENDIEYPAGELHEMCREAVARVCVSEQLMDLLAIPEMHRDMIAGSFHDDDPELYGRFDLIYDGKGPAKMIEYNADTPTSLYESASFQWQWLEDQIQAGILPEASDQFNSIHEALVRRFGEILPKGENIHFAALGDADNNIEDYSTTECLGWAAREAGCIPHYTDLVRIGLTPEGQFADSEDKVIGTLFKLYPWEDLLRDDFAAHIAGSQCRFIEPAWKAIMSNKGLLPVLWEMFEGHPNLLASFFKSDFDALTPAVQRSMAELSRGYVTKPVFSREGSSITITENGNATEIAQDQSYDENPMIVQAYREMPVFDGFRPVLGAWIVGRSCVGLGIREDRSRITQDLSRFKPHFIRD